MERLYLLKKLLMAAFFFFLLVNSAEGQYLGMIVGWKPFRVKSELQLSLASEKLGKVFVMPDELYEEVILHAGELKGSDDEIDSTLKVFGYRNVRISFSRILIDKSRKGLDKGSGSERDALDTLKSLPGTFQSMPYRDSLESMGKIFEPQVNLEILF